jgi:hypothetical protein
MQKFESTSTMDSAKMSLVAFEPGDFLIQMSHTTDARNMDCCQLRTEIETIFFNLNQF